MHSLLLIFVPTILYYTFKSSYYSRFLLLSSILIDFHSDTRSKELKLKFNGERENLNVISFKYTFIPLKNEGIKYRIREYHKMISYSRAA